MRGVCTDPYAGKPLLESARRCSLEEVKHVVARRGSSGPDPVALVEIDLYGDLMIAASSADEDRLSTDRIDEVLRVQADRSDSAEGAKGTKGVKGAKGIKGARSPKGVEEAEGVRGAHGGEGAEGASRTEGPGVP
ncbi:hypothetical protein TPA0910_47170 [Streptomyces hygroscopicus subsp. sporocinereus]|uniref:Uncharacterized protein n=2 Tax=Streptomyces hygroscopicus TaxID=1912 RepID=A0ABQ3U3U5_STRHY|nr:hypothetical protein TPA0910_47170 [Streptomyces hygroscopicus]